MLTELDEAKKLNVRLVMVDLWPTVSRGHKWYDASDRLQLWDGDTLAVTRDHIASGGWAHRVQMVQFDVVAAAKLFLAQSVWAVFIDANHTYECVNDCITEWTPKLKPGGHIGGHDYYPNSWPDVVEAVNQTYGADGVTLYGGAWEVIQCPQ
jgi:hypothetical protein